jgi:hypothetical protein
MRHDTYKIKNMLVWAVMAFVLILGACNPKEPVPREFPDEDKMAEILADLYVTESLITHGRRGAGRKTSNDDIPAYYKKVLVDHNLTSEKFDTIRKWYVAHPYRYQQAYDLAIVKLSSREAELNRKIKAQQEKQDSLPEIEDLWTEDRAISVGATDTIDRRLPFYYEVDSVVDGEIRLTGFYKFLRADLTREGRMMLITQYADSTADTITKALDKSFKDKSVTLLLSLDSIKPVTGISGMLFDHDTTEVTAIAFSELGLQYYPTEGMEVDRDSLMQKTMLQ